MGSSLRCATSVGTDGSRPGSFSKKASCGGRGGAGRGVGHRARFRLCPSLHSPSTALLPQPQAPGPAPGPHLLHRVLDRQVLQEAGGLRQAVAQHPRLQQRLWVEAPPRLAGQQALVVGEQLLGDVVWQRGVGRGQGAGWAQGKVGAAGRERLFGRRPHERDSNTCLRRPSPSPHCSPAPHTCVAQVFCAGQRHAAVHLLHQAAQAPGVGRPRGAVLDSLHRGGSGVAFGASVAPGTGRRRRQHVHT